MGIDEGEFLRQFEQDFVELAKENDKLGEYEKGFIEIAKILKRDYNLDVRPEDLRRQFMFALKDELESIPRALWRLNDPTWLKDLEFKAREKVVAEISMQIEVNKDSKP